MSGQHPDIGVTSCFVIFLPVELRQKTTKHIANNLIQYTTVSTIQFMTVSMSSENTNIAVCYLLNRSKMFEASGYVYVVTNHKNSYVFVANCAGPHSYNCYIFSTTK